MSDDSSLPTMVKRHFGFDAFLPLQEEIVADSLAGRDVFALLPTGGGKSLCYQLPALLRPGVTVVVSPLIALMKDQVDALRAGGVEATYINSSLDYPEQQRRGRDLLAGRYRLLYVAPERVMQPSFLGLMRRLEIGLIAIDEAHCISEWGHDFRPDYRQLVQLRREFPQTPVMALTATATLRVRDDILEQLGLENPAVHVGSFNRPNLVYHVWAKADAYAQLLRFVRQRAGDSGIIYCHARRTAESVAERLAADGVVARAYHAGMTAEQRGENQDLFARDDVPVICATVAFGMGINKSNVRYVFHYDMPKSMEGYHQETGRSGRDGLPAECVLLYGLGDAVRFDRLIDEKQDANQREIARDQLQRIVAYADSRECRRRQILTYFGECYEVENCAGCDNCLNPAPTFDATETVRKFLACVFRIREKSGFSVGITHVAAVLAGANTEKVRKFGHQEMSVYGAGKEHSQAQWSDIGRQLVSQGLLRQNAARFNTLELTPEGTATLREHRAVTLAELRHTERATQRAALPECDETLFERLRVLRKKLAEERSVAAFMVFSDVALRQMARDYPGSDSEFMRISGVGDAKLKEFGPPFMGEIDAHLQSNSRQDFAQEAAEMFRRPRVSDSPRETLRRFRRGESVAHIAQDRGLALSTVMGHLAETAEAGEEIELADLLSEENEKEIAAAFAEVGTQNLTGVRDRLAGRYAYGLLKLYRALRLADGRSDAPGVRGRVAAPALEPATASRTTGSPTRSPELAHAPASQPA